MKDEHLLPQKITTETPAFNKQYQIKTDNPEGLLVMIAPLGWHFRWYLPFIQSDELKNWNILLYAGRGLRYALISGDIKTGIHAIEHIRDDVAAEIAASNAPIKSIFGVSFGATTALEASKISNVDRTVLVAPPGDLLKSVREFNKNILSLRKFSGEDNMEEEVAWVESRMDSLKNLDSLKDKSVLLYTSDGDTIVPHGADLAVALKKHHKLANHYRYKKHRHLATALKALMQGEQWIQHVIGKDAKS